MTPIFQTDLGQLYLGHALDVLRELPDESVQCCVTSPPYWGLRDYGLEPMIWDGPLVDPTGKETQGCEHEWGETTTPARNETKPSETVHKKGFKDAFRNSKEWVDHKVDASPSSGQFCLRCGA